MNPDLYLFSLIVSIILGCIFGAITKYLNEKNGYFGGFAWGFWLGIIGIIIVLCRQPAYRSAKESIMRPVEKPVPNTWKCSCGRYNAMYISSCVCGLNKHQALSPQSAPVEDAVPAADNAPDLSADELKKISLLKEYKELLDTGVITQEEFDAKKKSVLAD